ncbi:MAG TPA: ABC-F family ATP-binding cassette domain-containing protein [Hyphomicrobiaceae bacterium]|jgi:ATP-binding cassette subfamily F protein 3|nr:ABC-F family ATP-binding cassette domain-containing protein [Hyphomicrobiaceae bacterium]
MLHINDLTYRIQGRTIFDGATAGIPAGHKVGLVGRNGAGKTTLLRLIAGELAPDDGGISVPRATRVGWVAQEAPGGPERLIDFVLAADSERAGLLCEAETANDPERIADIHQRLADIGAYAAPAKAARILAGLGFDESAQQRPCAEFSGGWRTRVALAAVLFTEPDLLLLDEPTNYLDLEGTLWLEDHLRDYPHTVLIVSHDRDLLNRSVTSILHLAQGRLTLYGGGYDQFEETRREKQRLDLKLKKKQDDERRHIEAFIARFKAKASKATQAQSRVKALARMQPIAAQIEERVAPFQLPNPAKALASPLVRLEGAAAGYAPGEPVLKGLDLRLDADDRVGLLGANGNGKSTFARLIAGRMAPTAGRRHASDKMTVGYFAQHQMEDLPARLTPYDHMTKLMPEATEAQRRTRLGTLGFGIDKADTRAEKLSGGEKARLLLALAAFHAPHLLILDEPTNHLDVDAREALVRALNEYEGAVILISHDRHLMDACTDRLWLVRGGTVKAYDGDMESYRAECLAERGGEPVAARGAAKPDGQAKLSPQEARRLAAERRAALGPLQKEVARAEAEIERLTREIAAIDKSLADSGLYAKNAARAQALARERGALERTRAAAEAAWLAASEAYEAAQLQPQQDRV